MDIVGSVRALLFNPELRIGLVRETFTDSAEILSAISTLLKSDTMLYLFHLLYGKKLKLTVDRAEKLTMNLKTKPSVEGNVGCHGADGSLTGKHYDKIICDDFVTFKDRYSRAKREKTKNIIRDIQVNIIDPGKSVCFIGTPWHKDDAWLICPEPLKFDYKKTKLLSEKEIMEKRNKTTASLFAANYELKHIASEDVLFSDFRYNEYWYNDEDIKIYGHFDAGYDGEDFTATTVMGLMKDNTIQATGKLWAGNIIDNMRNIAEWFRGFNPIMIFTERNADKGYSAKDLGNYGFIVDTYQESMNKHVKITTYLKNEWDRIRWWKKTDTNYIDQIADYNDRAEHDDAPCSASSLIRERFSMNDNLLQKLVTR